jgi:membrane protein insertase Oxa1/YidC/SpoIIIJ
MKILAFLFEASLNRKELNYLIFALFLLLLPVFFGIYRLCLSTQEHTSQLFSVLGVFSPYYWNKLNERNGGGHCLDDLPCIMRF